MKIGIVVWQLDVKGGTQRQALEFAQYLSREGHQVIVYAYLFDREKCFSELCEGLDIRYVKLHQDADISDYPKTYFQYFIKYFIFFLGLKHKELFRIIDSDIDVLNPHDCGTYVTAGLWKARYKKPVVWMMNDMSLFKWNIRNISKTIGYYIRPQYRKYIQRFEKVVVLDHYNRSLLWNDFKKEGVVVRSGLDIEQFKFVQRIPGSPYKILVVSVLYPHRRMEDAIRAVCYLKDWGYDVRLEHVGSTRRSLGYTRKIQGLVKRSGLEDSVTFHGAISNEELSKFYEQCDFYLFANSPQTWGLSVFEAMASGMPVVLTSGCGASEILTDKTNAMVIEPYCPERIAHAIARLIYDENLCNRIVHAAHEFVRENISWEKYSSVMLKYIQGVYQK